MGTETTMSTRRRARARRRAGVVAGLLVACLLATACAAEEGTEELADDSVDVTEVIGTPEPDDGAPAPAPTVPPTAPAVGEVEGDVASGFEVATHGFSFENYGDEPGVVGLLPGDVARMFGATACASGEGESCVLTPPAAAWMDQVNEMMSGGHCEGMAVLSLLMQQGRVDPQLFGGPTAASLVLTGNERLQREIAFWFVTQAVSPTSEASMQGAPSMVVERLRTWLAGDDANGGYTVGIYKPDGADGHAVTPIGLDEVGPGRVDILIYDNNYPGEVRRIEVDLTADTWSYVGSTNPEEEEGRYEGDAETSSIELTPLAVRLAPQAAPFLDGEEGGEQADLGTRGSAGGAARVEVFLDPEAFRSGVTLTARAPGGGAVPGLTEWRPRGADLWNVDAPPVLRIPVGQPFELVLDATGASAEVDTDIAIIGGGFDAGVDAIFLQPGQRDVVSFDPATLTLRYTTSADESPSLTISHVAPAADVDVALAGVELGPSGGTLEARLDVAAGTVVARTTGGAAVLLFAIDRYTDDGVESFENDGVELAPGETLVVDVARWGGNTGAVPVGIDTNGDGTVDETFELADET